METLAYLHIATNYEESTNTSLAEQPYELNFLTDFNWKKLPNLAWINCVSLVLIFTLLSVASDALALQRGQRGAQVTALQTRLKRAGYYKGPITGYYGALTEAAVKRSQRSQRIRTDGVAGTKTASKLAKKSSNRRRVARVTNNNSQVRNKTTRISKLQNRLKTLGYYDGPITGYYGPQTKAALKKFQQARGLSSDGIAGPKTSMELNRRTVFL